MKYTLKEIQICQGMKALYNISKKPFILDKVDIFNVTYAQLDYMDSIPYLDQIKTKKLFKLIILAK